MLRNPSRSPAGGRKPTALAGALAVVALVFSATGATAADGTDVGITDTTINLGSSNTLSGPGGASCTPITEGAAMWFDKVNESGGVRGRTINFKVLDDGYDPARAIANVRTFQDDTFILVGACGSATAAATYELLSESMMGLFGPTNGSAVVVKPPSPGIFQIIPLYEDQIGTLIKAAFGERGPGSVFTVVNPLGAYDSILEGSQTTTADLGGTFIDSVVTPLGTADYTPIALQVKEANPDYLVTSMGGSDTAKFLNTLVQQDALPAKLFLGTSASVAGAFLSAFDTEAADILRFTYPVNLPLDPESKCGELMVGTQYEADSTAILGCVNAVSITTALEETPSLTREDFWSTIEGWDMKDVVPGVVAPLSFSPTNHVGVTTLYILTATPDREFSSVSACPYAGEEAMSQPCTET